MFKNLHLKSLLLLAVMLIGGGSFALAETKTYKHVLTANELNAIGQTSATLADNNGNIAGGVLWTVTPTWSGTKPNAMNVDGTKGQQYGSSGKAASSLVFSTSHDFGTVTAVKVNASTAASATATIAVKVGSTDFTHSSSTSANLSTTATDYEFIGSASGTITITLSQPSTTKALYVKSLEVTYEVGAPVPVTGITLDPTTADVEVGGTVTLTPNITPANATNKNVTWESSDEDVATVSNGVVTGVAAGTATITATTEDGPFATCVVTVKNPATPTLVYDFTDASWNFPEDYVTAEATYTNGLSVKFGASSTGHKVMKSSGDIKGVIFGKQDATLSLSAFPFNVSRIKVYGIDGASGKVTFNVFVGDEAASTEVTSAKVTHTFDIAEAKQTSGNIFTIKVTNDNNCQISRIEVFGYDNVPVGETGFATYCSRNALDFSDVTGLTAYTASLAGDIVTFNKITTDIPNETGVLLKGAEGTYKVPVVDGSTTNVSGNKLVGVIDATGIDGTSGNYYVLKQNGENVGFYKVVSANYTVRAHSAYLDVDKGSAKGFIPVDGTTAIELVDTANEVAAPVYNLQGQRVSEGYKGVVIVNGKKIMMK